MIHVNQQIWKSFNSYNLRNQINDAFQQKENMEKPVIASVTRSHTGLSVMLTTMPDFNADFLLEKKHIWEEFFSQHVKTIEKNTQWHKIVVHGVPVAPFAMDEGLDILKNEIETFNLGLKLAKCPNWLSSEENRQIKRHASIVFAIECAEQAKSILENKFLYIADQLLKAEKYSSAKTAIQCSNYQKLGHLTRLCQDQSCCQICAEKHHTKQHTCNICETKGVECVHSILKCRNCGEDHKANSNICKIWEKSATQLENSINQSEITDIELPDADFAVVITNESKW